MQTLKEMLAEQHRNLDELSLEFQRKEVTPARVVRLMKLVKRNVDLIDRIVLLLDQNDQRISDLQKTRGESQQ
jgi:hypothetical protein